MKFFNCKLFELKHWEKYILARMVYKGLQNDLLIAYLVNLIKQLDV